MFSGLDIEYCNIDIMSLSFHFSEWELSLCWRGLLQNMEKEQNTLISLWLLSDNMECFVLDSTGKLTAAFSFSLK